MRDDKTVTEDRLLELAEKINEEAERGPWCPYCREEQASWDSLTDHVHDTHDAGRAVLEGRAVSIDAHIRAIVRDELRELGFLEP